jgi:hypothetical protein
MPSENITHIDIVQHPEFDLTPETGAALSEALASEHFMLWGHGTNVTDPESFFNKGVYMNGAWGDGGYDSITSIALPLTPAGGQFGKQDIADMHHMAHWPHKRGDVKESNVVLLAVPHGDLEAGIPAGVMDRYLVDTDQGETFPADLVVGFFDPMTRRIRMNPSFRATPELRQKYLQIVKARADAAPTGLELLSSRSANTGTIALANAEIVTTPVNDTGTDDIDLVW